MITKTKTKNLSLLSVRSSVINKQMLIAEAKSGKSRPNNKTKLGGVLSSYINKCSGCYDKSFTEILKSLRPDWFISITSKNKEELIKLAKDKKSEKPNTTSKLGLALNNYTRKTSKTYDIFFHRKIKSLRPEWFVDHTIETKKTLLRLAKTNCSKPNWKTKLGTAFKRYCLPNSRCFDKLFSNKLRKIAPGWFVTSVDFNKEELIKLAKDKNSKKPNTSTVLGRSLRRYQFDPYCKDLSFVNKIKSIRPDWFLIKLGKKRFVKHSSYKNKQQILKIAKDKKKRPGYNTKLGKALGSYTHKKGGSYDCVFDKEIRGLCPHWFKKSSFEAKQEIMVIAKNGMDKPKVTTKLGRSLSKYTYKSSCYYDESFTEFLTKARPDWFLKLGDLTKQEIIDIAKAGKNRPHHKSKLGNRFKSYITKSSATYDENFTKNIRKLRPDWFRIPTSLTKKELLKLAKKSLKRPHYRSRLGMALCAYTSLSHGSHDPGFTKNIKKISPKWFRSSKK